MAAVIDFRKALSLAGLVSVPELAALSMTAFMNCCWWRILAKSPSANWYRCLT